MGNYLPEINPRWCTCSGLGAQLASGAAFVFKARAALHLQAMAKISLKSNLQIRHKYLKQKKMKLTSLHFVLFLKIIIIL